MTENETDFEYTLDSLDTSVFRIDKQFRVLYLNESAQSIIALNQTKCIGARLFDLCVELGCSESQLTKSLEQQISLTINATTFISLSNEALSVDVLILPCSMREELIIEIRKIETLIKMHQHDLMDNQQQQARYLVRSLAHEIKNPLGGLRGAAQLLQSELQAQPELLEFTDMIIAQADRLRNLVDNLLGPQKPKDKKLYPIHKVIERVLMLINFTLPSNANLIRDYDPSIPDLYLCPEQMEQVLLNVIQNAQEACIGDPLEIQIRTRIHSQVTIANKQYRSAIGIDITDNGPGIPASKQESIFYPMVSHKEQGTGMGLSIAQHIIKLHSGRIDCHSSPGKTTFTILLPLTS